MHRSGKLSSQLDKYLVAFPFFDKLLIIIHYLFSSRGNFGAPAKIQNSKYNLEGVSSLYNFKRLFIPGHSYKKFQTLQLTEYYKFINNEIFGNFLFKFLLIFKFNFVITTCFVQSSVL